MPNTITIYGPGQTEICQRCVEHLKHDVEHRIVEKFISMSFPSDILDDEMRDLIKLRLGQRNGRTEAEREGVEVSIFSSNPSGGV